MPDHNSPGGEPSESGAQGTEAQRQQLTSTPGADLTNEGSRAAAGGHPVDGDQGAVDHQAGVQGTAGVTQCPAQLRGAGGR